MLWNGVVHAAWNTVRPCRSECVTKFMHESECAHIFEKCSSVSFGFFSLDFLLYNWQWMHWCHARTFFFPFFSFFFSFSLDFSFPCVVIWVAFNMTTMLSVYVSALRTIVNWFRVYFSFCFVFLASRRVWLEMNKVACEWKIHASRLDINWICSI